MEKFSKKDLVLRETTYKKKNVKLKEMVNGVDTTVNYSNFSQATNALNKTGSCEMNNNPEQREINQTVIQQGNQPLTTKDVQNQIGDNAKVASDTNSILNLNVVKAAPNQGNNNQNSLGLSEGVIFSKREMNQFLKSL